MKATVWKVLAIVFASLFILETLFIIWGVAIANREERVMEECYYDVCAEYPNSDIDGNVCYCYDYDLLGQLMIAKTTLIK